MKISTRVPKENKKRKETCRVGRDRDSADEHHQKKRNHRSNSMEFFREREREFEETRGKLLPLSLFWSGSKTIRSLSCVLLSVFLFFRSFFSAASSGPCNTWWVRFFTRVFWFFFPPSWGWSRDLIVRANSTRHGYSTRAVTTLLYTSVVVFVSVWFLFFFAIFWYFSSYGFLVNLSFHIK